MDRVTRNTNGTYSWSCRIDRDYHRKDVFKGLAGIMIIIAVILLIHAFAPSLPGQEKELWVVLIPIGVILLIALPLLFLQYNASDPHEQYAMNEEYIKSGYGKSSVYTNFHKVKSITITPKYMELYDGTRRNRIYVPEEDMDLVREFTLERVPQSAVIHHEHSHLTDSSLSK